MGLVMVYVLITYRPKTHGRTAGGYCRRLGEFRGEWFLLHLLNPWFIHLPLSVLTLGLFQAEDLKHARCNL